MARILLIQPNMSFWTSDLKETPPNIPLGLIYIGTVLKQKHSVKIYDRNIRKTDNELVRELDNFKPDIVGVTSMTGMMLRDAIKVSKIVRENTKAIIVWGGVHASLRPKNTLKNDFVDYVVRGEGELAMLEMANLFDKGKKNFSKLKNVNFNPMREFVDLNKIPFPDYDLIDMTRYEPLCISTSRGCPHRCAFCYNDGFWGKEGMKRLRSYSAENSIKMITYLTKKYNRKRIQILDDNFGCELDRTQKICEGISKLGLKFHCYLRANYTTDTLMSALKKGGAWVIQFGFESGSQKMLDLMKKDVKVEQMIHAVRQCKKYGIICEGSFMIGLPEETVEDLKKTMRFIDLYPPDIGGAKIFHPYPSTPMYDYCIKENLIKEPASLEEWADFNIQDRTNINVSKVPDRMLIEYQRIIDRKLIIKGYVKKFFKMLRQGYIPYKETLHGIKHVTIILKNNLKNFF